MNALQSAGGVQRAHVRLFAGIHARLIAGPGLAKIQNAELIRDQGKAAGGLQSVLKFALPHYVEEGKSYLTVAIGCTGGQHRSVYLAEELAKHLRGRNGVDVVVRHLGLENLRK